VTNSHPEQEEGRDIFNDLLQPWLDTTDVIFHDAQILIVGFDRELRYRCWNRYAEQVTGYPAQQVLGRRAIEVFPTLRDIGAEGAMLQALGGETVTMPRHIYRHHITNEERFLEATYIPLRGSVIPNQFPSGFPELGAKNDVIAGVLVIGRDRTTRSAAAETDVTPIPLLKDGLAADSDLRQLGKQIVAAQGQAPSVAEEAGRDPYTTLSGREREVLQHVAEGMTNAEIGTRLFISRRTVEVHRANVMRKLGLRSQAALIRYALRRKLIRLDP
jgi:DNA-binding CsgD family transcriptional regulator